MLHVMHMFSEMKDNISTSPAENMKMFSLFSLLIRNLST